MAVDDARALFAHDLTGAGGHEAVGRAVETVAADGVVLVVLIRNGVNVRFRRHGHAERGVEHGDLRHAGHRRLARLDAHEVGGVVQRPEREALFDGGFARVVHDAGLGELNAAVEHTVADGADLRHRLDNAVFLAGQLFENGLDRFLVGGERNVRFVNGLAVLGLVGQTAVDADALTKTFGEQRLVLHVDELILQRRAAGVDNQNLHWFGSFP